MPGRDADGVQEALGRAHLAAERTMGRVCLALVQRRTPPAGEVEAWAREMKSVAIELWELSRELVANAETDREARPAESGETSSPGH